MVEVDQHHHAGFRGDAGQRDEAHDHRDAGVVVEHPHQPDATDQCEGHRQHHDQRLGDTAEVEVQQEENQRQRHRNDDTHLLRGTLHVLVLSTPGHVVARRELHLLGDRFLRSLHVAAEIALSGVDVDVRRQHRVLGADARRTLPDLNPRQFAQRHLGAAGHRHKDLAAYPVRIVAEFAGIAHDRAEALTALEDGGDDLAAERGRHHVLHLAQGYAVLRQAAQVGGDVEVVGAGQALGERAGRPRHFAHHGFDLGGQRVELLKVRAEEFDAHGRADAGGQHVGARLDRHRPGVGDARELQRRVHLGDELVGGHAVPPFVLGLEVDDGLEHLQRCGIGGRQGTARLAEHRLHFREALDDPVLLLQQLRGLGHRHARKRRGHVQQRAFVEGWHELAAQPRCRPQACKQGGQRKHDCGHAMPQNDVDHRPIGRNQEPVHRILVLGHDLAAHEQQHEYRYQRDRQQRATGHREGLGEGQRLEQATFLSLQGEHGQERDGDDHQAEEQRRPDLATGIDDQLGPAAGAVGALDVLVRVLDHHDRRVDHHADRDRDAAQAHDVGVHAQRTHRDDRDQHADGQHDDRDQRAARMEQEYQAHQCDDQALLEQRRA